MRSSYFANARFHVEETWFKLVQLKGMYAILFFFFFLLNKAFQFILFIYKATTRIAHTSPTRPIAEGAKCVR